MATRSMRPARVRRAVAIAAPVVALLVAGGCGDDPKPKAVAVGASAKADYQYTIPEGTAKRLAAGAKVSILPGELTVHVGQTIRIINQDDKGLVIGPFWVDAHGTVTQRFEEPGTFKGDCAVHASGKIVLKVLA